MICIAFKGGILCASFNFLPVWPQHDLSIHIEGFVPPENIGEEVEDSESDGGNFELGDREMGSHSSEELDDKPGRLEQGETFRQGIC